MTTNLAMSHLILGYKEAYKKVDALAIAPYFHASQKAQKRINSVDEVFKLLRSPDNRYSVPSTLQMVEQQSRIAAQYGLDLIAYEGGQHLVAYKTHSNNDASNQYLIQANKDERMAKLYYDFLKGWRQSGGKLFIAFSAPRHFNWIGSWGIKEHIAQNPAEAPKYRALMYFQQTDKCWWYACSRAGHVVRKSKPEYNPGSYTMNRRFRPGVPTKNKKATLVYTRGATEKLDPALIQKTGNWVDPSAVEARAIQRLFNDPKAPGAWDY